MSDRHPLQDIKTFPALVKYLRDELDWPIDSGDFDDLTFDFEPQELGIIDPEVAAKIKQIKQLRPLTTNQPWGIFFVNFEPKRLPIVALRKLLSSLVIKQRDSANKAWRIHDLLFISAYGPEEERQITLAHFSKPPDRSDLPTLKVLGWDGDDTTLKLRDVDQTLHDRLKWPQKPTDINAWRDRWSAAFRLRPREIITTAKDLAEKLADLAKSIRRRVNVVMEVETDKGPLRKLYSGFREALIHDLDEDDFADMYAQTITYGLFSAAVSRTVPGAGTIVQADNLPEMVPITNPFLRNMLSEFLTVGGRKGKLDFDELGVQDVVELLNSPDTKLDAVLREFGNRGRGEDPVIHFYEDFLKHYDKLLKVQRGVFYTPQPVVSYIVRSVHELLQTEFGLADGLADNTTWGEMLNKHPGLTLPPLSDRPGEDRTISPDEPFVQILDPATGTATFLVEVIDIIHRTLAAKWKQQRLTADQQRAAWNDYVPQHLLPRLHAFELMMAPYAIAHMKIGLKLAETGYRFGTEERARIYLTNALEPWVKQLALIGFDALAHEAAAVNEIKRYKRFTVVIGNPPYSGLSANMSEEAGRIIEPYKYIDGVHFGERKHWLHDDYVKFLRLSETRVTASGVGVLGLITNHAFYDNPSFNGMRWNLLKSFDHLRLLDLHGNTMKREKNPEGGEDKNVFDIQQGVAISLFSKLPDQAERVVTHGDLWGTREHKYAVLSREQVDTLSASPLAPSPTFYFFVPRVEDNAAEYQRSLRLNEIFEVFAGGFLTARDHFVIDFDRTELLARIEAFADASISDAKIRENYFAGCGSDKYPDGDTRGWKVPDARRRIRKDAGWKKHVYRCLYRPFDIRWIYWTEGMVDWPRPKVNGHLLNEGNLALVFMRQVASGEGYSHFLVSRLPVDNRACYSNKGIMTLAPLHLHVSSARRHGNLFDSTGTRANYTPAFIAALRATLGNATAALTPEDILHYAYAVFHSPGYRSRYAEFLKIDFPRLPLTGNLELFGALARLGSELTALHLLESPRLNQPITEFVGSRHPEVEKISWSRDTVWVDKAQTTGFRGVREAVWNFHIGGYQVCQKWLKDRKSRTLTKDDIVHYHKIVVALSETIRIMGEIDEVIEQHGGWPGAFITEPLTATTASPIPVSAPEGNHAENKPPPDRTTREQTLPFA
jgi:predicted helicase